MTRVLLTADTIGGVVMQTLDRLPQRGDEVQVDGLKIEVLDVAGPRIERLRVTATPPADELEDGG